MISNVLTKQFFSGVACSIICAAAFFTFIPALAATAPLGPVYIDNVTAIESAIGSHVQGNMEIKIKDGFPIPAGLSCIDSSYITTLKSGDPTLRMFILLTLAQIKNCR